MKAAQWLGVKGLESTFEEFEGHKRKQEASSQTQTNLPAQGDQMWNQLLSMAAENKDSGSLVASNILQQIESNVDTNVMVAQSPPVNPSPEQSVVNMEDSGPSETQHSEQDVPLRPLPEIRLDVNCDSPPDSEKNFEGCNGNGTAGGKETKPPEIVIKVRIIEFLSFVATY